MASASEALPSGSAARGGAATSGSDAANTPLHALAEMRAWQEELHEQLSTVWGEGDEAGHQPNSVAELIDVFRAQGCCDRSANRSDPSSRGAARLTNADGVNARRVPDAGAPAGAHDA